MLYDISNPGQIPQELFTGENGFMATLDTVDLSTNMLTGTLPPLYEQTLGVGVLTYCNVSHNRLSGTIPQTSASLTNLVFLDFAANSLTGVRNQFPILPMFPKDVLLIVSIHSL